MAHRSVADPREAASYRSGVAARLAGVPVETLRVWERRYGVVGPRLSPRGQRLYCAGDVRRLTLVKQLVDMGHAIGTVASLPDEALIAARTAATMLAPPPEPIRGDESGGLKIVLIGPVLFARRLEQAPAGGALRVVARFATIAEAIKAPGQVAADVTVIEFPTLNDASLDVVVNVKRAFGASQAIVLYRFSPSTVIRQLRAAGHEVARAPPDSVEIASLCWTRSGSRSLRVNAVPGWQRTAEPPPPQFDERALSELASASTTVFCECPRHLVELLRSLGSFEQYSAECENRGPNDAALHRDLRQTAGHARVLLEEALMRVALAEGLPVPAAAAGGTASRAGETAGG